MFTRQLPPSDASFERLTKAKSESRIRHGETKARAPGHESEDDAMPSSTRSGRRSRREALHSASSAPSSKLRAFSESVKASSEHSRSGRTGFTALMRAAHSGDVDKMSDILDDEGPEILFAQDAKGKSAMDWARISGHAEAVKFLSSEIDAYWIEQGRKRENEARLARAVQLLDDNVAFVRKMFAAVESEDPAQIYKVANELTTTGDEVAAALQTCAENGVARDHGDHSATGKAAWVANLDLYQCPLDVETYEGWTPLCRAALIGDPILAKLLLKKGCNPNKTTRLKHTALTWACYCNTSEVVLVLLEMGADPLMPNPRGDSPLIVATRRGSFEAANVLIDGIVAQAVVRCTSDRFASIAKAKAEKQASFGKSTRSRPSTGASKGDEGKASPSAASSAAEAILRSEKSHRRPRQDDSGVALPTLPRSDVMQDLLAALAYRDPFGKQALDYADEGDRAFRAKSFGKPDFDPDSAHRCVMTELLIAAVDRLKVRLDVTKQDERNEVRHACGLGCGWKGPFVWKFSHEWLDCINREMKCPKQCGAVMRFRDLAEHEMKVCPHREVPCKRAHLGCDVILPVYQLGLHEDHGCRYRGIACPLGCGREFRQDEKNRHLKYACKLRIVTCAACGTEMEAFKMRTHCRFDCEFRLIACSGAATLAVQQLRKDAHDKLKLQETVGALAVDDGAGEDGSTDSDESSSEIERTYRGNHPGCAALIPFNQLTDHLGNHCVNRPIPCRWCSNPYSPPDVRHTHEQHTCVYRPVPCRLSCDAVIPFKTMDQHCTNDCPRRLVPCRRKCGSDVMFMNLDVHERRGDEGECDQRPTLCRYDLVGKLIALYDVKSLSLADKVTLANAVGVILERESAVNVGNIQSYATGLVTHFDATAGVHTLRTHAGIEVAFRTSEYFVVPEPGQKWKCGIALPHSALKDHMEHECSMRLVACRLGCGAVMQQAFIREHVMERCVNRVSQCSLGCGERFEEYQRWPHEAEACQFRAIACVCGQSFPANAIQDHIAKDCVMQLRFCPNSCGKQLFGHYIGQHTQFECGKREVPCPEVCGQTLWADELDIHLNTKCPNRKLKCKLGCGQLVRSAYQPIHAANECVLRPVRCKFDCGVRLAARDIGQHEASECEMRIVDCAAGCGLKMRFRDREAHELLECGHSTAPCKYNCGATPMYCLLRDHEENECPRRPTWCPRKCGASLWFQDVDEHLLICPRRLLVCSSVTDTFERDILFAGRNGRSASELAAMVQDECANSSSSSSNEDTDSDAEGIEAPIRRKRKPVEYTPYEKELMEDMTLEERFAFAIGREKMRAKDKAMSQNPNLQLTYCFKELSDWVFTPLLAIPYAAPNGLTLFPEAAQQPRLYPLTDPFARARATAESKVRFVRRVGNRLFDVNTGELTNPEVVNANIRYAPEGQMDGVTDFREPVVSKATYVDPLDSRFNRQLRRRGAVLFAGERAKALANGLALAPHNAMIQMCVTHGSNPLFRAIYKNDLQLVALIAKQLSRVAINAESHLGDLPLTLACRFGYRKIAEVLIDNGAEVNSESSRGLTPLGEAAAHNHLSIVHMLLDRRVDVAYKTRQRTTASKLARLHGNEDVLKVLEMREGLQLAHDALIRAITLSDVELVRRMVSDGEPYKRNHLHVLESRLEQVIIEIAANQDREQQLIAEIAEAERQIQLCYEEMYGEGWDAPDPDAPQFGEFKQVIVRPPTPPDRVPRRYRGTQGALRMNRTELDDVQMNLRYLKAEKVELHKKIWVARLLRFRSFTGHTALCWAAALDHEEIVDLLFLHGGNPSVDDDVLIASADLIRAAWHYYCWKKSPQRAAIASVVFRIAKDKWVGVQMTVVLGRRRAIRASCRVPICEALYNSSRNAFSYLAKQGTPLHIGTYVYPIGMIPVAMFPEEEQTKGSCIVARECERPLSSEEVLQLAVKDLGCKDWLFGEGWTATLQGRMKGDLSYAKAIANADGKRSLVEQSKIALRLVKSLARKKEIMFAAMAEYDWQTVLQCIDDGLNPNDEAPNGQSVMTFAAERAAYVSLGFLKSIYGPTYRAPKQHSTSLTRDRDEGVWFGEKFTGERPRNNQSLDWGAEKIRDPLSRVSRYVRKDESRPHRLKRKIVDRASKNPLVKLSTEDELAMQQSRAEKAAAAKAAKERELLVSRVLARPAKGNFPESPTRQISKDGVPYGQDPHVKILPVSNPKERVRSSSISAPVRYAVEFLSTGWLKDSSAPFTVPPMSPSKRAAVKSSSNVKFKEEVAAADTAQRMARRHSLQGAAPEFSKFFNGNKPLSPPYRGESTVPTAVEAAIDEELGVGRFDTSLFGSIARGRVDSVTSQKRRASSVDAISTPSRLEVPKLSLPSVQGSSVEGNIVVSLVPFGGPPLQFTPISEDRNTAVAISDSSAAAPAEMAIGSDSESDSSEEDDFAADVALGPLNDSAYLEDHEASDDLEVLLVAVFLDKDSTSKPSLNCNTTAGFSALMRAAEFGQLHVMEALMRRGANVNFQSTVDGSTAVMRAAARGQYAAVRMLCERGANLKLKDSSGRTAIEWAAEYRELQRYIAAYSYGSRGELTAQPGAPNPLVMCKFGCGAYLPPRLMAIHQREGCPKRLVECGFDCGTKVWAEELLYHQMHECPKRQYECARGCGMILMGCDQPKHDANECPNRICSCWRGCAISPRSYHSMKEHCDNYCAFRLVECSLGCKQMVAINMKTDHAMNHCPERLVRCRLGCDVLIPARAREHHELQECKLKLAPCKWRCGSSVPITYLPEHENNLCEKRELLCPDHCGSLLIAANVKQHLESQCSHRFVPCSKGCKFRVRAHMQSDHEAKECALIKLPCGQGCGETVLRRDMYDHEHIYCNNRLVPCGAGCGEKVRFCDLDLHKAETCMKRAVKCTREGCPDRIPITDLPHHLKAECKERQVFCRYGCQKVMLAKECRPHELRECPLRFVSCRWKCGHTTIRANEREEHESSCSYKPVVRAASPKRYPSPPKKA